MSATYQRLKKYYARLNELQRAGYSRPGATKRQRETFQKASARYYGYVKKHPRLTARFQAEDRVSFAPASRNPMGVSDLVNTPAYGAFGGAIREGKYVGGPMRWRYGGNYSLNPSSPEAVRLRRFWKAMTPAERTDFMSRIPRAERHHIRAVVYNKNPHPPAWEFQVMPYGVTVRHEGRIIAHMKVLPSGNHVWQKLGNVPPRVLGYATRYWKQKYLVAKKNPLRRGYSRTTIGKNISHEMHRGVKKSRAAAMAIKEARRSAKRAGVPMPKYLRRNPRFVQAPPGSANLAASRASQWRALGQAFPGSIIGPTDSRKNPMRKTKSKKNPKRRRHSNPVGNYTATITTRSGAVSRQTMRGTRTAALASARKLAKNPGIKRVTLRGPHR